MPIIFISDDHRMKRIKYININLSLHTKINVDKKLFELNTTINKLINLCD